MVNLIVNIPVPCIFDVGKLDLGWWQGFKYFFEFSSLLPGKDGSNLTCAYFCEMGWLKPPT